MTTYTEKSIWQAREFAWTVFFMGLRRLGVVVYHRMTLQSPDFILGAAYRELYERQTRQAVFEELGRPLPCVDRWEDKDVIMEPVYGP